MNSPWCKYSGLPPLLFILMLCVSCGQKNEHPQISHGVDNAAAACHQLQNIMVGIDGFAYTNKRAGKNFNLKAAIQSVKAVSNGGNPFSCLADNNYLVQINSKLTEKINSNTYGDETVLFYPVPFVDEHTQTNFFVALTFNGNCVRLAQPPLWAK